MCKVDAGIFFARKAKNAGIASATARLFNAASGKKSKSKCINLALENYKKMEDYFAFLARRNPMWLLWSWLLLVATGTTQGSWGAISQNTL